MTSADPLESGISARGYVGILAAIAALAYALRLYAVPFGYPLATHPDEPRVVGIALAMARTGELNPGFFNYGSLSFYLLAGLFRIDMWVHGPGEVAEIHYYVLGRIFVATLAMGTIVATAETARISCGRVAGLAAAALLGASLLHTASSFTVTVDVPATFWTSLSLLVAAHGMRRGPSLMHFAGSGALAGLAIATKYIVWPALLPIAIVSLRHGRGLERWLSPRWALACCAAVGAFFLAMPYALLDAPTFASHVVYERVHYAEGTFGVGPLPPRSWASYAENLVLEGWGILPSILSLAGLAWLLRKDPWTAIFLAVTPLALFVFVGSYRVWFARNLTAALPCLAVLGGAGVLALLEALRALRRRRGVELTPRLARAACAGATVLAIAAPLQASWRLVTIRRLPDTRVVLANWIQLHVPPGTAIAREALTAPLEELAPGYEIIHRSVTELMQDTERRTELLIVSSKMYDAVLERPDLDQRRAAAYRVLFRKGELLCEVVGDDIRHTGPTQRLYKLPPLGR